MLVHLCEKVILLSFLLQYQQQTVPDTLQTIPLKVYKTFDCQWDLKSNMTVYSENFCTKVQSGKGICYGDSGSPVVYNNKQCGFVQRVVAPCATGKPDVHVSVSYYSTWITQNAV